MQVLITGGTGYLGSRLAAMLSQSGHNVLALTRAEREMPSLACRVAAADAVIHTACCYGRAGESSADVFAVNMDWSSRLLETFSRDALFLNADTVLPAAMNSYAASKELFRESGPAVARRRKARWFNLRLEHFFGPGEGNDKFITRMVRACLAAEELKLTRGTQKRDFIFIDDVVRAFDLVLRIAADGEVVNDFYVGTGNPVRIRDLVERIHRLCGSRGALRFGAVAYRKGEPMDIVRPGAEPLDRYGWRPVIELQKGLEQVVQFENAKEANPCVCS